jgi:hypothetical protein
LIKKAKFVGINNWPEKKQLIKQGKYSIEEIPTKNLVFDCERHIQFLQSYIEQNTSFNPCSSLYYAFYFIRKNHDNAMNRCLQYKDLFSKIKKERFKAELLDISVTRDGARLDGSHRSVIAFMLGIETLRVRVFDWSSKFRQKRINHISQEICIKQEKRHLLTGKQAVNRQTEERFTVLHSDYFPIENKSTSFLWLKKKQFLFDNILALEGEKGCTYLPLKDCKIIEPDELPKKRICNKMA